VSNNVSRELSASIYRVIISTLKMKAVCISSTGLYWVMMQKTAVWLCQHYTAETLSSWLCTLHFVYSWKSMHGHDEKCTRCHFCLAVSLSSYLHIKQYETYFVLLTIFRTDCYLYIWIMSGEHGTVHVLMKSLKLKRNGKWCLCQIMLRCFVSDMGISVAVLGWQYAQNPFHQEQWQ